MAARCVARLYGIKPRNTTSTKLTSHDIIIMTHVFNRRSRIRAPRNDILIAECVRRKAVCIARTRQRNLAARGEEHCIRGGRPVKYMT